MWVDFSILLGRGMYSGVQYFMSYTPADHKHSRHVERGFKGPMHASMSINHSSYRIHYNTGRIRDLEKEWPFWSAFGGWFEFEPVLVRKKVEEGDGVGWRMFGVPGESWLFVGRRRAETLRLDAGGMSDVEIMVQGSKFEELLQMSLSSDE